MTQWIYDHDMTFYSIVCSSSPWYCVVITFNLGNQILYIDIPHSLTYRVDWRNCPAQHSLKGHAATENFSLWQVTFSMLKHGKIDFMSLYRVHISSFQSVCAWVSPCTIAFKDTCYFFFVDAFKKKWSL